jgi:DNA-binding NtrC family response regulator
MVSDYAMPDLNGVDLIAGARICQPGPLALIITGFAGARSDELLKGTTLLLQKPFRREELIEALRRTTDGSTLSRKSQTFKFNDTAPKREASPPLRHSSADSRLVLGTRRPISTPSIKK